LDFPYFPRLGLQQFWHHHWYSDTNMSSNLQQDELFENLLNLYLTYGLNIRENLFIHEYWYSNNKRIKSIKLNYPKVMHSTFYRRYYYLNNIVGIEHNFLLRNSTPEYFPLKLWLFKFNNWVILNVTWFKPMKGKNRNNYSFGSASAANVLHKPSSNFFTSKRLKLLLSFFYLTISKKKKTYSF
jgi:hypothetical protein